jgi:hypothetical protein
VTVGAACGEGDRAVRPVSVRQRLYQSEQYHSVLLDALVLFWRIFELSTLRIRRDTEPVLIDS